MALVVENGTGLATADSYLSATEFRELVRSLGLWYVNQAAPTAAWFDEQGEDDVEAALRRATLYLDGTYGARWRGFRVTLTQGRDWPRTLGCELVDPRSAMYAVGHLGRHPYAGLYYGVALNVLPLAEREVPVQVKQALAQIAVRELARPGGLLPDDAEGSIVEESVGGTISVKYDGARVSVDRIPMVEALLTPLLLSGTVRQLRRA